MVCRARASDRTPGHVARANRNRGRWPARWPRKPRAASDPSSCWARREPAKDSGQADRAALQDPADLHRRHSAGERDNGYPAGSCRPRRHGARTSWFPTNWCAPWWPSGFVRWIANADLFWMGFRGRRPRQDGWMRFWKMSSLTSKWLQQVADCDPADVDYNELLRRLTGRRSCPTCGRIYNVYFQPPQVDELCDVDGTKLVIRADDREEVIRERLNELMTADAARGGLLPGQGPADDGQWRSARWTR